MLTEVALVSHVGQATEVLFPMTASLDEIVTWATSDHTRNPVIWDIRPKDRIRTVNQFEGDRYGRLTIVELKAQK